MEEELACPVLRLDYVTKSKAGVEESWAGVEKQEKARCKWGKEGTSLVTLSFFLLR